MCAKCRTPEVTVFTYPEHTCAVQSLVRMPGADAWITVQCTNAECGGIVHHDSYMNIDFTVRPKLGSSSDGNVKHA